MDYRKHFFTESDQTLEQASWRGGQCPILTVCKRNFNNTHAVQKQAFI